jgi:hypothetical protein
VAIEQLDPAQVREDWIVDRINEFNNDPTARDRAIAIILWDSLKLNEMMGELAAKVQQGGVGGLLKGLMGAK